MAGSVHIRLLPIISSPREGRWRCEATTGHIVNGVPPLGIWQTCLVRGITLTGAAWSLVSQPRTTFAANELKTMLAYIVHSYDVKFEKEGVRPANVWFSGICLPHQSAEVMFRKRAKAPAM